MMAVVEVVWRLQRVGGSNEQSLRAWILTANRTRKAGNLTAPADSKTQQHRTHPLDASPHIYSYRAVLYKTVHIISNHNLKVASALH
jgi:hypothetical protein